MRDPSGTRIETTLGELIVVVSEAAFESAGNAEEAYALTAVVLSHLLAGGAKESFVGGKGRYVH